MLCYSADGERRPLALIRQGSFRYVVYDPVTGTHRRVQDRMAAELSTDAWMVYRPLPEGKLGLFDLFRFSIGQRRRELTLIMVTGLAATLLGMITPQATALMMDHAIPDASRLLVFQIGAALLAAAFGQTVFKLSQGIVLMRLGIASGAETQAAVWDRLLRLRPSFFRRFSSGDLQSRVMSVSAVGRELTGATLTSVPSPGSWRYSTCYCFTTTVRHSRRWRW